eukprot:1134246-Pelagomonas_calceolata.AAC.2
MDAAHMRSWRQQAPRANPCARFTFVAMNLVASLLCCNVCSCNVCHSHGLMFTSAHEHARTHTHAHTHTCSPLAVLVYFDAYSLGAVMTAMAVGFSLGLGVHILTKDEEGLPTLDLGTRSVEFWVSLRSAWQAALLRCAWQALIGMGCCFSCLPRGT